MHPGPMTARRRLLRLAPLVAAGFALGIAIPRAAQVAHVHAGGQRAHVHLGADRHAEPAAHRHAHPHAADHAHADGHAHHHGGHAHRHGDHAHAASHAATPEHALVVPHDATHVHWQAPFQRAVAAALPPVLVVAIAGPVPVPATPRAPERARPASRSRGPPRA